MRKVPSFKVAVRKDAIGQYRVNLKALDRALGDIEDRREQRRARRSEQRQPKATPLDEPEGRKEITPQEAWGIDQGGNSRPPNQEDSDRAKCEECKQAAADFQ